MSQDRVIEALVKLGLSKKDAEVYIYLAAAGPQKAETITNALEQSEQQVNQSLKNLETKGIVKVIKHEEINFRILPFIEVLDLLLNARLRETKDLTKNKMEILSEWKSLIDECSVEF